MAEIPDAYTPGSRELLRVYVLRNHTLLSICYPSKYDQLKFKRRLCALMFTLFVQFAASSLMYGAIASGQQQGCCKWDSAVTGVFVTLFNMWISLILAKPFAGAQAMAAGRGGGTKCGKGCGKALIVWLFSLSLSLGGWGVWWQYAACIQERTNPF